MTNNNPSALLTRQQCTALRGVAIAGIVLHNYCHWLGPAVKENEYTFSAVGCRRLAEAVASPDGWLPVHLLSFFGHYGVPLFVFLSAYGLVRKYEDGAAAGRPQPTAAEFMRYHFLKLFKMMIVGFVAFTMVDAVTPGSFHYGAGGILAQMGMFNNLLPDPDHVIWPGPYWFFGLMLQLYAVYRLLLYRRGWGVAVAAVVVCWALQAVQQPDGDMLNRLRYNSVGAVLPFAAGLLAARHGRSLSRTAWAAVLAAASAGVVATGFGFQAWLWTPLLVCAAGVALVRLLPTWAMGAMQWLGGISAAMFVMHPLTRKIFIPISRHGDVYTGLLLYVIASVALAWLCRELMKKIPDPHLRQQ